MNEIKDDRVCNTRNCETLSMRVAEELCIAWKEAYENNLIAEIANGCYCGKIKLKNTPFESLAERCNWLGYQIVNDESGFGIFFIA